MDVDVVVTAASALGGAIRRGAPPEEIEAKRQALVEARIEKAIAQAGEPISKAGARRLCALLRDAAA